MGEKAGFIAVLFLFFILIVPFGFYIFEEQVKMNRLLSFSIEMQQLLEAEGEVSNNVNSVVSSAASNGIIVNFSGVDHTRKMTITYEMNSFNQNTIYRTSNVVYLSKR